MQDLSKIELSRKELSELFEVSIRQIDLMREEGIITPCHERPIRYNFVETIRAIYKDARAKAGGRYPITMKVTIKDGKIASVTDIKGDTNVRNKVFLSRAAAKVPASVVKNQSAKVDAVSGATCSSKAIMDGVSTAVAQARA